MKTREDIKQIIDNILLETKVVEERVERITKAFTNPDWKNTEQYGVFVRSDCNGIAVDIFDIPTGIYLETYRPTCQ